MKGIQVITLYNIKKKYILDPNQIDNDRYVQLQLYPENNVNEFFKVKIINTLLSSTFLWVCVRSEFQICFRFFNVTLFFLLIFKYFWIHTSFI